MSYLDIAEIIFVVIVFVVGLGGFIYAATSDDDKSSK